MSPEEPVPADEVEEGIGEALAPYRDDDAPQDDGGEAPDADA